MSLTELEGCTWRAAFDVKPEHLATNVGSGSLDVLSTPSVLAFAENLCTGALQDALDDGLTSVGTTALVRHRAAIGPGLEIEGVATATAATDRSVSFTVTITYAETEVATIEHTRAVVDVDRFLAKLPKP